MLRLLAVAVLFSACLPLANTEERTATERAEGRLFPFERGIGIRAASDRQESVYLWFYEWNMFDAMQRGQHTRGDWSVAAKFPNPGKATIEHDALQLTVTVVPDGAKLVLNVKNKTDYPFPEHAAIIPCFNPGPAKTRNPNFANTNTWFLAKAGLQKLSKREIHFNSQLRSLVNATAKNGEYVWSPKWPLAEPDAFGGLIVRESTDGKWVAGIAWERFLSAQGHNPWECMHLSVRVGPLAPNDERTINGRIYLIEGRKEDLLKRYRKDFGVGN